MTYSHSYRWLSQKIDMNTKLTNNQKAKLKERLKFQLLIAGNIHTQRYKQEQEIMSISDKLPIMDKPKRTAKQNEKYREWSVRTRNRSLGNVANKWFEFINAHYQDRPGSITQ